MAASRSKTARKSASTSRAHQTAPLGETEAQHRARTNAIGAQAGEGAGTDRATEVPSPDGNVHPAGNLPAIQHQDQPDKPADTTVRHAEPPTGKQDGSGTAGEGGFPQGEYDVTNPAPAPLAVNEAPATQLLEAHLATADVEQLKALMKDSTLDDSEYALVIEAAPVGFTLEHEAPNRWRAHQTGVNRFGHGQTAKEAIEHYVLGGNPTAEDAGARAFAKLSTADQQAIRERDANAIGGGDVNPVREQARRQALKGSGSGPASGSGATGASGSSTSSKQTAARKRSAASKRVRAKQGKKSGSKKSKR